MSVTVVDDDWIRTHDEARDALRYAAIGATVVIELPAREHVPETRMFTIVVDAAPGHSVSAADAYSLPCLAAPLMRRARTLCDRARRSLAYAK